MLLELIKLLNFGVIMSIFLNLNAKEVDIAFLLEGSYPFALGGVSAWVHQLIENFPQYTFGLIFLGGSSNDYPEGIRYPLLPNVTHFQVHYLFDEEDPAVPKIGSTGSRKGFATVKAMHDSFKCPAAQAREELGDLAAVINSKAGVDYVQFLYSKLSWNYIKEEYSQQCEDSSFIDYFWTVKNLHKPLWKLMNIINDFPHTKVVHTASTGYAGLLSYFIHQHFYYPIILTEHGIYTRERKIDIFLSDVFRDIDPDNPLTEISYLRNLWERFFKTLAQLTYQVSNPIISLFNQAHEIQIQEGADANKAIVIPNGVDIEKFKRLRKPLEEKEQIICFIGRVVPIKDVKGFIRVVPNLCKRMENLKVWIVGSIDQDIDYAQECVELVKNTLLEDVIQFMPHQDIENILPRVKLLVLPSIREGMPLTVLEGLAAGVPIVATDVGSCRELILGLTAEDIAIGPAGTVVKVANPEELETAIWEILSDTHLWRQMSRAAIQRAETFYDQKRLVENYLRLYQTIISQG